MKRILFSILINLVIAKMALAQWRTDCLVTKILHDKVNLLPCNNDPYVLVFEDNFDGSSLDLSKWTPDIGVTSDFNFNDSKQWNSADNIEVSNGTLKLIAKKQQYTGTFVTDWETIPYTTKTATFDYTSAQIVSKKQYFHGKYEIRCRIPNGTGFWPAFWMYGNNNHIWNEIDVFDNKAGNKEWQYGPIYDFDGDGKPEECRVTKEFFIPDFSQWHIFTCIYDDDKIEWQLDNKTITTMYRYHDIQGKEISCGTSIAQGLYTKAQYFPLDYMNIIADLRVRSNDAAPDASTPFPSALEIDYIRYYMQGKDCCPPYTLYENRDNLPATTFVKNYIKAGYDVGAPTANGNVTVKSGQNVTFRAGREIGLLPGFSVASGATFGAEIKECSPLTKPSGDAINVVAVDNFFYLNGDGVSHQFCTDVDGSQNYTVEISGLFDGEVRYTGSGSITGYHVCVWDASCNATACHGWSKVESGYYAYVLKFSNCSNTKEIKGWIRLFDNNGSNKTTNYPKPEPNFSKATSSPACSGEEDVQFTNLTNITYLATPACSSLVTGKAVSENDIFGTLYTWDFGDGSPVLIDKLKINPTHNYTSPGIYHATLNAQFQTLNNSTNVWENTNCSFTFTDDVVVPELMVATISGYTNVSCNGGSNGAINLTATGGTSP